MAESSDTSSSSTSSNSMGLGMRATLKMIHVKFPKVKDITTDTLADWLQAETDKTICLYDCREEKEFVVSHIAGAQRVDWENVDPQQLLDALPQDKPCTIVCYCSIGYRSSAVADKLQQFLKSSKDEAGRNIPVYNLEGSLFKWANEGRAMINSSGQSSPLCHPYSAVWGKLLNKELRSTTKQTSRMA